MLSGTTGKGLLETKTVSADEQHSSRVVGDRKRPGHCQRVTCTNYRQQGLALAGELPVWHMTCCRRFLGTGRRPRHRNSAEKHREDVPAGSSRRTPGKSGPSPRPHRSQRRTPSLTPLGSPFWFAPPPTRPAPPEETSNRWWFLCGFTAGTIVTAA